MRSVMMIVLLGGAMLLGIANSASAQEMPSVRGLQEFSIQTNFMSYAGFLRWQYFVENNTWISVQEAKQQVNAQRR